MTGKQSNSMESTRESHVQQIKCRRIILFPLPLQGHINPMFQLAEILYSKGFSITIIHTNFNSPNPSKYPHFTFNSIQDGLLGSDPASTEDVTALLSSLNVNCVEPFRDSLSKLLLGVLEEPIVCLITDVAWLFPQAVAEGLKLPRIAIRTTSICSFLAYAFFPRLLDKGYFPVQDSQLEAPVQELSPLKFKDLPIIEKHDLGRLHQLMDGVVNQAKTSSGLIWNSFEELEQVALTTLRRDFPIPIFTIGPFYKYFPASSSSLLTQDKSCISWLDT